MAPAARRSVSTVLVSAKALRLQKAAKALQEKHQFENNFIWLALGAIVVSGTATGFFLLDKVINYFKGKRISSNEGNSKSASEDEGISDEVLDDDALAEGIVGLNRRRKRAIAQEYGRDLGNLARTFRQ